MGLVLFSFSVLLYCISTGLREGFTWANKEARIANEFIYHKGSDNNGLMSYHQWRIVEFIGLAGLMITYDTYLNLLVFLVLFPVYEVLETYVPRCKTMDIWDCIKYQKGDWSFGELYISRPPFFVKYIISAVSLFLCFVLI